MSLFDIFISQITDPFRIALLVALGLTTLRTSAVTGAVVPLAAGVVFVAVIIPTTLSPASGQLWQAIGVGLVSNTVWLAVLLGLKALWQRFGAR